MADKQPSALLPSPAVIDQLAKAGLDPATLATILTEHHKSKARYAMAMGLMGGFCFLCSVGGSIYLVMQHHKKNGDGFAGRRGSRHHQADDRLTPLTICKVNDRKRTANPAIEN